MDFNIEKTISNFVESQFPQFYLTEGPNFVLFVKAYYEWLESEGQAVFEARNLFDYRDIDNTLTSFLEHFQKKYLYGIPFDVIVNKRFLLKHILDVYRSKGSINCYKLLFKLIYNQDVEVYLPGRDILKPSDGTWVEPRYIEVTNTGNLQEFVGRTVIGSSGNVRAVCEGYVREPVNNNLINILYLSNIEPYGGSFVSGEKILLFEDNSIQIGQAPTVIGSLNTLQIINGGTGFKVGDLLKIAHVDPITNQISSFGNDAEVRVLQTSIATGALTFYLINGGSGYNRSSNTFLYNDPRDITGHGGSFSLGPLSHTTGISYNTDLIINYLTTQIGAPFYEFPANNIANSQYTLSQTLSYQTDTFGTISSLTNLNTGNNYIYSPYIFVRDPIISETLANSTVYVTYNTTSNVVTGVNTSFTTQFSSNDTIYLQSDRLLPNTGELQVIKSVDSDTQITLYGPPSKNSTSFGGDWASFSVAPEIFPASFAYYEPITYRSDGTISGNNAIISAVPSTGNDIVSSVIAYNSGKGYVDGEIVKGYLFNSLNQPTITAAGQHYSNGDPLIFSGGGYSSPAQGFIETNPSGNVISAVLTYSGSGYQIAPYVSIKSANGTGAQLTTTVTGANTFNTFSSVTGKVVKSGIGVKPGYWSTTRGFLNSDKYIQDSYFYQDFSYQIKVANVLDTYKNILYNTFHTAGSELFGEFLLINTESSPINLLYDTIGAVVYPRIYLSSDMSNITSDTIKYTIDEVAEYNFTADNSNILSDNAKLTADQDYF